MNEKEKIHALSEEMQKSVLHRQQAAIWNRYGQVCWEKGKFMNEWEKIVLPLKGKQEIQKRSPGTFHVEARRQDEATVISGEYCFEGDRAFFSELLKTSLETLAERIQQEQGLIGHIKTSLEIQDTEVFSVTLDKADCRKGSFSRMEGKLAAIVFFVRPKTAEKFVREMLENIQKTMESGK